MGVIALVLRKMLNEPQLDTSTINARPLSPAAHSPAGSAASQRSEVREFRVWMVGLEISIKRLSCKTNPPTVRRLATAKKLPDRNTFFEHTALIPTSLLIRALKLSLHFRPRSPSSPSSPPSSPEAPLSASPQSLRSPSASPSKPFKALKPLKPPSSP